MSPRPVRPADRRLPARLRRNCILPAVVRSALFLCVVCVLCAVLPAYAADAVPAFEDSMAQRALACTGCHGREGRASSDGFYPRIAGKPAGYLYNQLLNFRDGRRSFVLMTHLLQHLSDDYLQEMARYFADLDLPYPPPQAAGIDALALERGRALVLNGDESRGIPACAQCHGAALTGVAPAIPGLLGLPRDYLNSQFGAWRIGLRKAQEPDCMAQVARQLAPEDIAALTAWLAAQPVPTSWKPADSLPAPMPLRCGALPDAGPGGMPGG
jgi:cytochrome c553